MASDETTRTLEEGYIEEEEDDDYFDDRGGRIGGAAFDDERFCDGSGSRRMSRLSIEGPDGEDADAELSNVEPKVPGAAAKGSLSLDVDDDDSDKDSAEGVASMPGTPDRMGRGRGLWMKEYASETEARRRRGGDGRRRRRRRPRERWLERAWEQRRNQAEEGPEGAECRVLVRGGNSSGRMSMDMEEVKACRDLGLGLPGDWTVEIPIVDTSSGGNSPVPNWRISGPGDDPKEVKARLKVWAQAVALASASHLN